MFGKKKDKPDPAVRRCSFCNKTQHDVRKLIAGPKVNICDECVDICIDILAVDRKDAPEAGEEGALPPSSLSACALCRLPVGVAEALFVEGRGLLCSGCLGEIEAAMAREGDLSS
jgi:hypothetical protein